MDEQIEDSSVAVGLWGRLCATKYAVVDRFGFAFITAPDQPAGSGNYDTAILGNTCFFRHPETYNRALDVVERLGPKTDGPRRILCAGGSVGMEAYSLAYMARVRGYDETSLNIVSADLSAVFTSLAADGVYPRATLEACSQDLETGIPFVHSYGNDFIRVRDEFRRMVTPVNAAFVDLPKTGLQADVTISLRAFMYIIGHEAIAKNVQALADVTGHMMLISATCDLPQVERFAAELKVGSLNGYRRMGAAPV